MVDLLCVVDLENENEKGGEMMEVGQEKRDMMWLTD
jgi:hypothetical protein